MYFFCLLPVCQKNYVSQPNRVNTKKGGRWVNLHLPTAALILLQSLNHIFENFCLGCHVQLSSRTWWKNCWESAVYRTARNQQKTPLAKQWTVLHTERLWRLYQTGEWTIKSSFKVCKIYLELMKVLFPPGGVLTEPQIGCLDRKWKLSCVYLLHHRERLWSLQVNNIVSILINRSIDHIPNLDPGIKFQSCPSLWTLWTLWTPLLNFEHRGLQENVKARWVQTGGPWVTSDDVE